MNAFLHKYGDLVLTCALALFFWIWPDIDLSIAARFYQPGVGFPASQVWWVKIIYNVVAKLWVLALVWLFILLIGFVPRFRVHIAPWRKMLAYLLVTLLVGPGLIVNSVLKDHWGRPRPVHLAQFGGTADFAPPLVPDKQCASNCAFVSGHAAVAFYPIAGFWLTRRRRWLVGGIASGLFVGYLRMAMGAHFLSDVLFAGIIVHLTCRWLAYAFRIAPTSASCARKQASIPSS